jgi:transcriptional regulator with XRE-family HTH domain
MRQPYLTVIFWYRYVRNSHQTPEDILPPRTSQTPLSPSQIAAERIYTLRKQHLWTQQQLSNRLEELGSPIDRVAITRIEAGDRRLPLDEVFLFALALDVAPINLFLPLEEEDVQIASRAISSATLRSWVVGDQPLGGPDFGQNPRTYFSEAPEREFLERIEMDPKQFKRELVEHLVEQRQKKQPNEEGGD